jgi:DNA-binding CsgD family transcriptional regulator
MDWLIILHCLVSLGLGLYSISWCYQIYQHFRLRYISSYFYYLVAVVLYGIFAWSGKCLGGYLAPETSGPGLQQFEILFTLVSFPLVPISIFLFVHFAYNLVNRSISAKFQTVYWIFWLAAALSFAFNAHKYLRGQENTLLLSLHGGIGVAAIIIRYIAVIFLLKKSRSIRNPAQRKLARWLGIYYCLTFGLYFSCTHFAPNSIHLNLLWPLFFFSLHLPPLFRLHQYVYRHHIDRYIESKNPVDLNLVFNRFKISPREREIIILMLNGKTNREIEDTLYIALGTVKNHTTNIYKKFGVTNRRQLLTTIKNTRCNE